MPPARLFASLIVVLGVPELALAQVPPAAGAVPCQPGAACSPAPGVSNVVPAQPGRTMGPPGQTAMPGMAPGTAMGPGAGLGMRPGNQKPAAGSIMPMRHPGEMGSGHTMGRVRGSGQVTPVGSPDRSLPANAAPETSTPAKRM